MTRRDIEFSAEDVTLRGWFYPAQGPGTSHPTIVMAHGFSAVKEMYLDRYAEVFAAAGLNAWFSITGISAPATASPVRRSTRGRRSGTTATPSPTPRPCPRSTSTASACGEVATPVATCWWSVLRTAG